jgi:ATP-dependent DNA helicase RecQ
MAEGREFAKLLEEVLNSLRNIGLDFDLKEEQREAIQQLHDKKDLMAVLPTGYGKSLIFQLLILMARRKFADSATATATNATTDLRPVILVITPLVSIIKDQIIEVESMGLKGCNLTEYLDDLQAVEAKSLIDIIYASAESAIDDRFLTFLKSNQTDGAK